MDAPLKFNIKGHVKIVDDLGNVILDKDNAIHFQNMSRAVARALSNEANSSVYKVGFGNGGTTTDIAFVTTFYPPNVTGWNATMYNRTYAEVVDAVVGGDAVGSGDGSSGVDVPPSSVISNEITPISGTPYSTVTITCVLNNDEPKGQYSSDIFIPNTEDTFMFDEIALFTTGKPVVSTSGFQDVDIGNKVGSDASTLPVGTYTFDINVNGTSYPGIVINVVSANPVYSDLVLLINAALSAASVSATSYVTDSNLNTSAFGNLRFESTTTGSTSTVLLGSETLITALGGTPLTSVLGVDAGVQNDPLMPSNEAERLLAHVIFSPQAKAANRKWTVTYVLTVNLVV